MSEPKTIRLTLDGVTAGIFSIRNGGQQIAISGFTRQRRRFVEGANLIITRKSGEETQYRITKTDFPRDPDNQYFLDCTFHPREACNKEAQP